MNLIMKLLNAFLCLAIVICLTSPAYSQRTQPVPFDMSLGIFSFESWSADSPSGTYPPNMMLYQSSHTDPVFADSCETDWHCAYNLTSRSRIEGLGDDGIAFINTSQKQADSVCSNSGYAGEVVLALRTMGITNIKAEWTGGFVNINGTSSRQYNIRCQYRIGNEAPFTDIPYGDSSFLEYTYNGYLNTETAIPHEEKFAFMLPESTWNKELVQLRWKYYAISPSTSSGSRPKLRIDNIRISPFSSGVTEKEPNNPATIQIVDNQILIRNLELRTTTAQVRLFDVNGRVQFESYIQQANIASSPISIELYNQTLPIGVYLLQIQDGSNTHFFKVFISK